MSNRDLARLRENLIDLEAATADATVDDEASFLTAKALYRQLGSTRAALRCSELRVVGGEASNACNPAQASENGRLDLVALRGQRGFEQGAGTKVWRTSILQSLTRSGRAVDE